MILLRNHFVTANSTNVIEEIKKQLQQDHFGHTED